MKSIKNENSLLIPVPEDDRMCNYYVVGADVVIESISDYLQRVPLLLRIPGVFIAILYSATLPTRSFPIEQLNTELSHYQVRQYYFNLGITDECFTEFRIDDNAFLDGPRHTGIHSGVHKEISFDTNFLYICVKGGIAGVAIWKRLVATTT